MPFIETADQTSLFVTEWGSGPPVVFIHAWGLRSDEWDYQVPASDHDAVNADILAFIHGRPLPARRSLPGARDDQAAVRGVSIKT